MKTECKLIGHSKECGKSYQRNAQLTHKTQND